MAAKGCSHFILRLLCFALLFNPSLAYSLKNCTIVYQEIPSADFTLDCEGRKLMSIPDDLPGDAASIQLHNNYFNNVHKHHFCGMSKLKSLNLRSNGIVYVEDESFSDLVSLKTLYMKNNDLTSLTKNFFLGLSNLIVLDFNNNKIQFIYGSPFQFLTSLQILDLGNNNLQQIDDIKPILQLPKIQKLSLSFNQFSSFETKDFPTNSSSLIELHFSSIHLKKFSITTPIFPHLQILDLSAPEQSANLQWDIPDKTLLSSITHLYLSQPVLSFDGIKNTLKSLDSLSHLRLNNVDRRIEKGLLSTICKISSLRRLDLLNNRLDHVTLKFPSCSQLRELDLKETYITELSKGSIQLVKHLRSLNVSSNQLTRVPHDISNLTSLEILNIDDNQISELSCEDFVNTTNLTELNLSTNRITKLDRCVIESLTGLKLLDLSNNQLLKFGDSFKLPLQKLEFVDLSENFITILEGGAFQGLQSLRQLNVESDKISKVNHDAFYGLNSLEELVVTLPFRYEPNFTELQRLEKLTIYHHAVSISHHRNYYNASTDLKFLKSITVICRGNRHGYPLDVPWKLMDHIRHVENFKAENVYSFAPTPTEFIFQHKIRNLALTDNDFSDLDPEVFKPIPKLQILDLSQNKFKSLDFLLQANLTALRYLKLTDNEINVINETVFSSLPSLTYLDLSNNPFTCECSNAAFIQWIKNNKQIQVVNAHQYKCSFPVDKQGTLLLDFDIQPCWNDGSFFYFLSSTCLVVLTLLTSFIYHFLKWQLVYTFHLLLAFLYDSRRKKKGDPHQFDAFVSYNVHDEDWVHREMLPVLEGEQGWRLCLHHRDFQPGKPIIENITDAIYGSRKTICVISRHYLQSEWCSKEIQMARWGRCLSVSSSQAGLPTKVSLRYSGENLVLTFGTPWDGMGDWDGESTYDA